MPMTAGPEPSSNADLTVRRADPIISGPMWIPKQRSVLPAALVLAAACLPPLRAAQDNRPVQPPGAGLSVAVPAKPASPPPLPAGPAPDLALVFTDQVVGYVEPCG